MWRCLLDSIFRGLDTILACDIHLDGQTDGHNGSICCTSIASCGKNALSCLFDLFFFLEMAICCKVVYVHLQIGKYDRQIWEQSVEQEVLKVLH